MIIMASHHMDEIEKLCDEIIFVTVQNPLLIAGQSLRFRQKPQ
jgi:ABC-type Na+ transport system ATPase subunit NatA